MAELTLELARKIPCPPDEQTRAVCPQFRSDAALHFTVGKAAEAVQPGERDAFDCFRVQVDLGISVPPGHEQRAGKGVARFAGGAQTVGAAVRGGKGRLELPDIRCLSMKLKRRIFP